MKRYKITKDDLIGEIKNFPIEIVEKMIEEQTKQGNEPNVFIFQRCNSENRKRGGFDWDLTKNGLTFWEDVIFFKNFDLFFDAYSKKPITKEPKIIYDNEKENPILEVSIKEIAQKFGVDVNNLRIKF